MTATAPPPVLETEAATRWQRVRPPALMIGGLGLVTLALRLRDPHAHGSWGLCPSAAMGIYCPGCGGLRAVNDLTHGDVAGAASSNLMLVLALPVVVFILARWAVDSWTGRQREHHPRLVLGVTVGYLAALAVFTVLRNLPAGAWLAP
ncbi:DUF2752 domain-containing protein [Nocardioides mangrovi]|uniref:DUF2752 domain-containing protein n=1 Tax=Nocardioides mangrovi TaxID=2874580 RepID=A0ABS7U7N5_9ACTN|nr:DUF2752 domain-containing protein [Nocardioides mangrovi]MBZ5736850.1 DUF2752 domain-containing protein [Nocardioides mangrovi]